MRYLLLFFSLSFAQNTSMPLPSTLELNIANGLINESFSVVFECPEWLTEGSELTRYCAELGVGFDLFKIINERVMLDYKDALSIIIPWEKGDDFYNRVYLVNETRDFFAIQVMNKSRFSTENDVVVFIHKDATP